MAKYRDIKYTKIIKLLIKLGYVEDRRDSSHITMKAEAFKSKTNEDIITVQAHNPLVIKAVNNIIKIASLQTGIPERTIKKMLDEL